MASCWQTSLSVPTLITNVKSQITLYRLNIFTCIYTERDYFRGVKEAAAESQVFKEAFLQAEAEG